MKELELEEKKVIGIDFGGTKIKFAVVTETGQIIGDEILLPTESDRPAKEIFENDPTLLAKALDPDHTWSVLHFAGSYSQADCGGNGFNPQEWQWFGEALIKAGAVSPQTIGVHIAALVCESKPIRSHKTVGYKAIFNAGWAGQIFDGNMSAAMKLLLLEGVDIEKYDEQSKAVLYCARDEANKWLKQNNSSQKDNLAL